MTDHNAKYNQADALKDEGKLDEAIELLKEIVAEDPNHSISHFALAVLYGKVGQHDQACLLYTSPSPRDRQKSRMPSSA